MKEKSSWDVALRWELLPGGKENSQPFDDEEENGNTKGKKDVRLIDSKNVYLEGKNNERN